MTRIQGFARGDLDTSFPLDDKFIDLRASTDAATYYAAAGLYWHVVAAAWRDGQRKAASRICPDAIQLIPHLVRVKLLDREECVPKRAFAHAIGRATENRRSATARKARSRASTSRNVTEDRHVTDSLARDSAGTGKGESSSSSSSLASARANGAEEVDPYDQAVQWLASRKAWIDSPKIETALARMVDRKGLPAVLAAMAAVPDAEDAAQYVYGARNALFPLAGSRTARPPTKAEAEAAEGERQLAALESRRAGR